MNTPLRCLLGAFASLAVFGTLAVLGAKGQDLLPREQVDVKASETQDPAPASPIAKTQSEPNDDSSAKKQQQDHAELINKLRSQLVDEKTADEVLRELGAKKPFVGTFAGVTKDDRKQLLIEALNHVSPKVRRQAADLLQQNSWLNDVVAAKLFELLKTPTANNLATAVVGLERIAFDNPPDTYIPILLTALSNEKDYKLKQAAETQLRRLGTQAVPALLEIVLNETAPPRTSDARCRTIEFHHWRSSNKQRNSSQPRLRHFSRNEELQVVGCPDSPTC